MKDLYEVLGISRNADDREIKRAYRKMAVQHHPDKGGDEQKFKELSEAYEILHDSNKRSSYDNFGYDSVSGGSGINPMDIFKNMFRGGGGIPGMAGVFDISGMMGGSAGGVFTEMMGEINNRQNKKNVRVENIGVSLDELYNGAQKSVVITTKSKCSDCSGNGYFKNGKELCGECGGSKVLIQTVQMGPMIQQSRIPCHVCNARGYTIKKGFECSKCNMTGYIDSKRRYNLNIRKGNVDGKDIQLKSKGDYIKELDVQGDLVIKLQELPHNLYKRRNNDLFVEQEIELAKALCGTTLKLEYLNKTFIYINIDKPIKPDHVMRVRGKGMPLLTEKGVVYGDLLILFKIVFPTTISSELREKLTNVFGLNCEHMDEEAVDIEYYRDIDELNQSEEEGGIQCAHQ
jgi:DnaJ family protein A protein 2